MTDLFSNIYKNRNILITGHTGFKGSWLALWLEKLGAKVIGYSLEAPTSPAHFNILNLDIVSIIGDIRDSKKLHKIFQEYQPELVFHLAAQSLVRHSYKNPIETFETNIMGTINVFEECRKSDSIKGIVNITSDKCYKNNEWVWGYRENDPMGGYDPYSASKGCSEIITTSYRNSFFNLDEYSETHKVLVASARAGNVIGGGDWAEDRLIPDIIRALNRNKKAIIRNPNSIRPWQHVLESLSGYLMLGQKLLEGKKEYAEAWNFGSNVKDNASVELVLSYMKKYWDKINYKFENTSEDPHEATLLKLDCSKSFVKLSWEPVWDINIAIKNTVSWYREYYENKKVISKKQLEIYIKDAIRQNIEWTKQ